MRKRLLAYWGDVVYKRRFMILALTLLITAAAGYWIRDIPVDMSFFSMLDPDHPEVRRYSAATREFGASANILLVARGGDIERVKRFAAAVSPRIRAVPGVRAVIDKAPLEFISEYGLLLAPLEELEKVPKMLDEGGPFLKNIFAKPTLPAFLQSLNEQLRNTLREGGVTDVGAMDELSSGLADVIRAAVVYARKGRRAGVKPLNDAMTNLFIGGQHQNIPPETLGDGYFVSPDGSLLIITIRMKEDAYNMDLDMKDYHAIKAVVSDELKNWPGVEAGFAGIAPMAQEDESIVLTRILFLSKITLLVMALIFWWMSRNIWSPLFMALTLGMSVIWTFAIVRAVFGFVNMLSATFAILLFGLGVDFAIHIMTRHNEGINDGLDVKDALKGAITGGGAGIITGGLTTAFAFLAMNVSRFRGAHQLGTTTGAGILCCLTVMMGVFPALIAISGRRGAGKAPPQESTLLCKWADIVAARPRTTLAIFAAVTLISGFFVSRLEMVYDLDRILARGIPSIKIKNEVEEKFGVSMDYAMLIADNLEEAGEFAAQARANPVFKRVDSITDFLPEDQDEKLPLLANIRSQMAVLPMGRASGAIGDGEWRTVLKEGAFLESLLSDLIMLAELSDEEAAEKALKELQREVHTLIPALALPGARENMAYFQGLLGERLARIHDLLARGGEAGPITEEAIPDSIKNVFVGRTGKYLVAAYPKGNVLQRKTMEKAIEAERAITENSTGIMVMVRMNVVEAIGDFPRMLAAVFITLFILLMLDFRSVLLTILAIIPVIIASIVGLAIMYISGQMITVITMVAFPLIFGIGIDYAVHILHRYMDEKDVAIACSRTGRAIAYTSITTIIGFGILMLTNHNGLIGMGFLITVGVTLCFVTTVTALPAMLTLLEKK